MENAKQTIIWGTGRYGSAAYHYYNGERDIVRFIDSDAKTWGKTKEGIEICSPDFLEENNFDVIIASKYGFEDIFKQLQRYPERVIINFKIEQELISKNSNKKILIDQNTIVVSFEGGLGNQMFIYALLRNYVEMGKRVVADFSAINAGEREEMLIYKVFRNVSIDLCKKEDLQNLQSFSSDNLPSGSKILFYREPHVREHLIKETDMSILNITGGVINGYHQTHLFADAIRDILLKEFVFAFQHDESLCKMANKIKKEKSVAIHVRDFPQSRLTEVVHGNNCSEEYYQKSINYIKEREPECTFYVFSDNIEKAKQKLNKIDAVYMVSDMFELYEDWYDMFLMSCCKHNIIANSTFSWWGAWLNQYTEKIVVAPKQYLMCCDVKDIYPLDWIKL